MYGGGRSLYLDTGVLGRAARAASSTGVATSSLPGTFDKFSGRPRATITAIAIATIRRITGVQRMLQTVVPSSFKSKSGEISHYVGIDVGKDCAAVCDH